VVEQSLEQKPKYKVFYEIAEQAILKVGYPILVSAAFIAVFLGWIDSPIARMEGKVDAHIQITSQQVREAEKQTRLLTTICKALAKPQNCIEDLITR
jgi:hypothetical protein